MNKDIKLVAFDLDGVLVDGGGSWVQVHQGLGTYGLSRRNMDDYLSGAISFDEWARRDVELWKGTPMRRLEEILYASKMMPGVDETMAELKRRGLRIAIISGGLKLLADRLQQKYDLDYSYGNELLERSGCVDGIKTIVGFEDKGTILTRIASECGIETGQCAAVGDYLNDISMFKVAGFSVAFDPKKEDVSRYATKTVYEKDLRRVLDCLLS